MAFATDAVRRVTLADGVPVAAPTVRLPKATWGDAPSLLYAGPPLVVVLGLGVTILLEHRRGRVESAG